MDPYKVGKITPLSEEHRLANEVRARESPPFEWTYRSHSADFSVEKSVWFWVFMLAFIAVGYATFALFPAVFYLVVLLTVVIAFFVWTGVWGLLL